MSTAPPQVSVVIPTYNEATYIDRLLTALAKQRHPSFEVIVSDAESKDGTAETIQKFKDQLRLTLVLSSPKGPAVGRNLGAARAKGEWLLFLDADDDIDDPDFITTLVRETEKCGWQTATSNMKAQNVSAADKFGLWIHHKYLRLLSHTKHPVAPGFCILTRRELFETYKGFDETLWVGEDYDYVSRTAKHGFGFVEATYYYVDLRRFEQGGKVKIFLQSIGYEVYRFTHGFRITKDPFNYKFGEHKRLKQ